MHILSPGFQFCQQHYIQSFSNAVTPGRWNRECKDNSHTFSHQEHQKSHGCVQMMMARQWQPQRKFGAISTIGACLFKQEVLLFWLLLALTQSWPGAACRCLLSLDMASHSHLSPDSTKQQEPSSHQDAQSGTKSSRHGQRITNPRKKVGGVLFAQASGVPSIYLGSRKHSSACSWVGTALFQLKGGALQVLKETILASKKSRSAVNPG